MAGTPLWLNISPEAFAYAKLQRTLEYPSEHERSVDTYRESVFAEWIELEPYLPPFCFRALDFGCGIGAFSVLLWRRYREMLVALTAEDQTGENPQYGFREENIRCCYNDMWITRKFLLDNGVPERVLLRYHRGYDLVISLLAAGYHFPISAVLPYFRSLLRPGGTLIFDVRDGTGINPDDCARATYPVRSEGEDVLIATQGVEPLFAHS